MIFGVKDLGDGKTTGRVEGIEPDSDLAKESVIRFERHHRIFCLSSAIRRSTSRVRTEFSLLLESRKVPIDPRQVFEGIFD